MYCNKCGAPIPEGGNFCQKCGAAVEQSTAESQPSEIQPQPVQTATATTTNGFAIAALVCGIAGLFLNFLSILAIIFGALGIAQTNKNPEIKGKGMAVAGLVLGIVVLLFWVFIIFLIGSIFWWI